VAHRTMARSAECQDRDRRQMALNDRVAVITGAGDGMGRALVQEFVRAGARAAAIDINGAKAQTTVDELDTSDRAIALEADVSDPAAVERSVETVLSWASRIDVLCNNAGIVDGFDPAHEMPLELWDRVIRVNLSGPFIMSRAVIPSMLANGGGVILNTASNAAFSAGLAGCAYTASKHGLVGLTRQLTFEYGRRGIRVNAICPGAVFTTMTVPENPPDDYPDTEAEVARTPAGRFAQPSEVARFAVYLAGDEAEFMHGSAVLFDGGWLAAARNPM
jgi:3-oxoacyl-[acyl-carrier protein] reductase